VSECLFFTTFRRRVNAHHSDVLFPRVILYFVHVGRLRYDEFGVGRRGLLGHLRRSVEGVSGGHSGATEGGAEECEDELGAVLEEKEDDVALLDVEFVEAGGDSARGELDLGVGEAVSGGGVDEAGSVAELGDVLEDVSVEREVRGDVNVGEFGTENEVIIVKLCRLLLFHFGFGCYVVGLGGGECEWE